MDSMAWGITVQRSCTRHRLNAGLAARFVCFHPWKGHKSHHRKRTLLLVGMESQHSPMTEITTRITLVAKASQHSNHQHETLSSPLSLWFLLVLLLLHVLTVYINYYYYHYYHHHYYYYILYICMYVCVCVLLLSWLSPSNQPWKTNSSPEA